MGLVRFSDLLREKNPSGTYVIDTCFALAAARGESRGSENKYKLAYNLKRRLNQCNVGLVYIGVVRNEASHKLRESLFDVAISGALKKYLKMCRVYRDASREKLKEVQKAGYVKAFEIALGTNGKLLEMELDTLFWGCKYLSTEEMKPKPSWDKVRQIMSTYGLDSSDAMLLNFAVTQKTFRGLITTDSDFQFCNDVPGFDIVVPDGVLNMPGFRELD